MPVIKFKRENGEKTNNEKKDENMDQEKNVDDCNDNLIDVVDDSYSFFDYVLLDVIDNFLCFAPELRYYVSTNLKEDLDTAYKKFKSCVDDEYEIDMIITLVDFLSQGNYRVKFKLYSALLDYSAKEYSFNNINDKKGDFPRSKLSKYLIKIGYVCCRYIKDLYFQKK